MVFDEKFWLALAFLTFVLLLAKLAGKVIVKMINDKSEAIKQAINDANLAKEKAQKLLDDAKKYHQESKDYADKLLANATSESQILAQKAKDEIDAEIKQKTAAAIKRVEMEQEIAIKEVKRKIVNSALTSLSNSLKSDISQSEHDNLIANASKDLEKII